MYQNNRGIYVLINVPLKRYFIDFMGLRRIDTLSRRIDISLETIALDDSNFRKIDSCLRRKDSGRDIILVNIDFISIDTLADDDRFFIAYGIDKMILRTQERIYTIYIFISNYIVLLDVIKKFNNILTKCIFYYVMLLHISRYRLTAINTEITITIRAFDFHAL